jgi:hypothetical protein
MPFTLNYFVQKDALNQLKEEDLLPTTYLEVQIPREVIGAYVSNDVSVVTLRRYFFDKYLLGLSIHMGKPGYRWVYACPGQGPGEVMLTVINWWSLRFHACPDNVIDRCTPCGGSCREEELLEILNMAPDGGYYETYSDDESDEEEGEEKEGEDECENECAASPSAGD